jgi:hypothetical protein
VRKPAAALLALLVALSAAVSTISAAPSSSRMLVGIYDEGTTLFDAPATTFPVFKSLHVQVIRLNLHWGGPIGVARRRPFTPTDPNDSAYNWAAYDNTVEYASRYGVKVLFSIIDTPSWANGGAGLKRPPTSYADLKSFALAAAIRYSGTWTATDGAKLPAVKLWTAWNEPNNPVFLSRQFRKVHGKWVVQSAIDYAKICEAIYSGIHSSLVRSEQVACGVTAPRGNDDPTSARPSVSPLAFLAAVEKAGLKHFDAWAHHPYPLSPSETPGSAPSAPRGRTPKSVTLGNIKTLIALVTRYYGYKPIWITEYGYQTNPPDALAGVSWAKQAKYLTQAFATARANRRIQLMLWFLLRDEPDLSGWQSGLETLSGKRKPSFTAFKRLPH